MIIATHAMGLYSWQEIRRRSHDHCHTCNGAIVLARKSGGGVMIIATHAMGLYSWQEIRRSSHDHRHAHAMGIRIAAPVMLRLAMLTCGKFESVRFACIYGGYNGMD